MNTSVHEKFKLESQVRRMASKEALLTVLEKFKSSYINIIKFAKLDPEE